MYLVSRRIEDGRCRSGGNGNGSLVRDSTLNIPVLQPQHTLVLGLLSLIKKKIRKSK